MVASWPLESGVQVLVHVQLSHRAVRGGSASRDRHDEPTERRSMARTALARSGTGSAEGTSPAARPAFP